MRGLGKSCLQVLVLTALIFILGPVGGSLAKGNPMVKLSTSMGDIVVELYPDKAPITVENFLNYVKKGHYDGTVFHRIISGFVIQGGGLTPGFVPKKTDAPIKNEADNGLKNEHYWLSMARTNDPHSATSQFFINLADNEFLDHKSKDMQGWGYAVFGKVVEGMDVVDAIGQVETGRRMGMDDVPKKSVELTKAEVVEQ